MKPLRILICENYLPYYEKVLPQILRNGDDVRLVPFPHCCAIPGQARRMIRAFPPRAEAGVDTVLMAGPFCPLLQIGDDVIRIPPMAVKSCFSHLLSPGTVEENLQKGAYLLTWPWLARWEEKLAELGFSSPELASRFFRQTATCLLFISPGGGAGRRELDALSRFLKIPAREVPADEDYIAISLRGLLAECDLRRQREELEGRLRDQQKQTADYATMLDFIGKLAHAETGAQVVSDVKSALTATLAAETVEWLPLDRKTPGKGIPPRVRSALIEKGQSHLLDMDEAGFWLRITFAGRALGLLHLRGFPLARYLSSSVNLCLSIAPAIGLALSNAGRFERIRHNERKLHQANIRDDLTGLFNRRYFRQTLSGLEKRGDPVPFCIMVCDIDGLKSINDTLGHPAGDRAIRRTADILRRCFREEDVLARLGGDEFAAILFSCEEQDIPEFRRRIERQLEEDNRKPHRFHLSFSVGFSLAEGTPPDTQKAFRLADDNMYAQKRARASGHSPEGAPGLLSAGRRAETF